MTEQELAAYVASLPVEDEPISPRELAEIAEGEAAIARGEFATAEEIRAIVEAAVVLEAREAKP